MAVGKTSVGPVLAELLSRRFLDLDQEIEGRAGCSIASLIERDGEPAFRDQETNLLRETLTEEPRVIAPGGGRDPPGREPTADGAGRNHSLARRPL